MKAREVRDLTPDEQGAKLTELETELFNLRIQQTAGQLEKPDRVRLVRRDIARIRTIMNQAKAAR